MHHKAALFQYNVRLLADVFLKLTACHKPYVWSCYWHCCKNLIEKIHLENQLEGALIVNEMNDVLWNALTDHYVQKWRDSVWDAGVLVSESGGKLVLYRQLKTSPEL